MASQNEIQGRKLPRSLAVLLALLTTAVFINYIDRGNLSIAAPLLNGQSMSRSTRRSLPSGTSLDADD